MGAEKWQIGILTIYPFGLGLAIVYVMATWAGQSEAKKAGISSGIWWGFITGLTLVAVFSGRLAYIVTETTGGRQMWSAFWQPPVTQFKYWGVLLGGLLYTIVASRLYKRPLWQLLDLTALSWSIALMIAAVLWGAPIEKEAAFQSLALPLHIGYLTAMYWLVRRVYSAAQKPGDAGEPLLIVVCGDLGFRLLFAFLAWFFFHAESALSWHIHTARLGLGLFLLYGLKKVSPRRLAYRPTDQRKRVNLGSPGWLVGYGILLLIMIAINVL